MSPASRLKARGAAFALLLVLSACVLFAPSHAAGQQQPGPAKQFEAPPDGTELFRALLDHKGIRPIKQNELRNLRRYDDVIVIVLAQQGVTDIGRPIEYVRASVGSGGAALVATDSSLNLSRAAVEGRGQAEIVGAPVECTDPEQVLAVQDPDGPPGAAPTPLRNCPYVVPVFSPFPRAAPQPDTPIGAIFRDLTRVATNSPGYIAADQLAGEFRFPLARFPENTFSLRVPLRQQWFAVGGTGIDGAFNDYRFLAMADHSVFINQMLVEPGTDNLELAYRTIEFLQGPQQRNRCLFVENGRVVENFDTLRQAFASRNPSSIPNPAAMQEKLTEFGNKIIAEVQSKNVHNELLLGLVGLARVMWALLILASVYVTVYLIRRWLAARKPTDQPPPPTVAGAPAGPPGVFERRQKELLRRDNVYEPIRDLVREFFASIDIHGEQGPRHPKLVISDVVRKPDSLRQAVRDFWKLAFGPPQEVTVGRWRELEPFFLRLREAHADGKWRFVMPEAPVAAPA